MSDGGWNCERENGSVRGSFHTTINVLEGLLAAQTAHEGVQDNHRRPPRRRGVPPGTEALPSADDRRTSRPRLPPDQKLTTLGVRRPTRPRLLPRSCTPRRRRPDPRAEEALEDLLSRWLDDGRWRADRRPPRSGLAARRRAQPALALDHPQDTAGTGLGRRQLTVIMHRCRAPRAETEPPHVPPTSARSGTAPNTRRNPLGEPLPAPGTRDGRST